MINLNGEKKLELQLADELENIENKIGIQEKNKNLCNVYMKKISDYISVVNPNSMQTQTQFENTIKTLKNICDNVLLDLQELNTLKKLLKKLDNISRRHLKESIDGYNETYLNISQKIDTHNVQMQDFTASVLENHAFVFSNDVPLLENTPIVNNNRIVSDSLDNNVLIVSEKDQVAYLPYKIEDVENYLKSKRRSTHKYSTSQEVIDNVYTVPLSLFKFPTIARFREVFSLVRKESTLVEAFETAVELMLNFNLDPIIVRACRNVQELDIYVDCLEEEETTKFPCFEIKYEIAPTLKTRNKNEEFFA